MPRKEAMRSREVSKRGRVAEREDGASPAARRALRDRLPLASLPCEASQSSLPPQSAGGKTEAAHRSDAAEGGREQPVDPLPALGSPTEWTGPRGTCHLSSRVCVRHGAHGRLREGGEGEWTGGKGAPNATPKPARRVGGGRGVGTWASHGHQDEDGGRRPLACEQRGPKVPSACARCPRVETCGTGAMGTDASWPRHGERSQVLSRVRSKPQARFSTEGMRKRACCNAPCPYPTPSLPPLGAAHRQR